MNIAIIIPARYGSSRFPGKPLAELAGMSMLERVWKTAIKATQGLGPVQMAVATDDARIADHARAKGMAVIMTSTECATGSDRVLAAARQMTPKPDVVINLQGDVPLIPITAIRGVVQAFQEGGAYQVVTPVIRLSWGALDTLRTRKQTTPFSGTTVVTGSDGRAHWFSKQILPAIRGEEELREKHDTSPVLQHIGLYGYRMDVLERFSTFNITSYESLEGLEQLRLIENGITIQTVEVAVEEGMISSGVDTPEDMARVEKLIAEYGDPLKD